MREHKYRGKAKTTGEWVVGFYLVDEQHDQPRHCIWTREFNGIGIANDMIEVIPETVGKSTGLKDKNRKEIFENDIIKSNIDIIYVDWNKKLASFCLTKDGWAFHHYFGEAVNPEECEVIGNINDNPDFLK